MDITDINDLYIQSSLSIVEMIESDELSNTYSSKKAIDEYLMSKIKKKYCNKCNHMGYVNENIEIINRSIGKLKPSHFNGSIYYNIQVIFNICVPLIGSHIKCKIVGKNDAGVLCEAPPLKIMLCSDIDDLDGLEVGEDVVVEVLNYKVVINESNIKVLGRLTKTV